jgi:hypothetical protein
MCRKSWATVGIERKMQYYFCFYNKNFYRWHNSNNLTVYVYKMIIVLLGIQNRSLVIKNSLSNFHNHWIVCFQLILIGQFIYEKIMMSYNWIISLQRIVRRRIVHAMNCPYDKLSVTHCPSTFVTVLLHIHLKTFHDIAHSIYSLKNHTYSKYVTY